MFSATGLHGGDSTFSDVPTDCDRREASELTEFDDCKVIAVVHDSIAVRHQLFLAGKKQSRQMAPSLPSVSEKSPCDYWASRS